MTRYYKRKEIGSEHINPYKTYYETLSEKERKVYKKAVKDTAKYMKAFRWLSTVHETQEHYETFHDFRELINSFSESYFYKDIY